MNFSDFTQNTWDWWSVLLHAWSTIMGGTLSQICGRGSVYRTFTYRPVKWGIQGSWRWTMAAKLPLLFLSFATLCHHRLVSTSSPTPDYPCSPLLPLPMSKAVSLATPGCPCLHISPELFIPYRLFSIPLGPFNISPFDSILSASSSLHWSLYNQRSHWNLFPAKEVDVHLLRVGGCAQWYFFF